MKKVAVLVLATLMLAACTHELTPQESMVAENGALKYATAAGGSFVSCSGLDSNNDSYVTCSIKDANQQMSEIVCSYGSTPGCKLK